MAHRFDFAVIRERVTPEMVFAQYSLEARPQGKNLRTVCPFHGHSGKPDPGDLSVDAEWRFQCFSCKAKGRGALKFVELTDNIGPKEAAERIYGWFGLGNGNGKPPAARQEVTVAKSEQSQNTAPVPLVNIPLREKARLAGKDWDGKLKLDHAYPYLAERGFDPKLCEEFGVGYTSKGYNAGRIAFPIANVKGEIVGYSGRLVDEKLAWKPKDNPKFQPPRWQLPAEFHAHLELFNIERVVSHDFDTAVIVESPWGVLALARAGIKNGVATLGKNLSDEQADLLGHFRHVILMFDGNAKEEAAKAGCKLLARNFESVKVMFLPDEEEWSQPDRWPPEDLYELF
ncbi:MAG: toprim domain-containing protein [Vicinamibacterales bacterium]|nr:toprim domain-containing protein [Vicinamibacterales bacterium]